MEDPIQLKEEGNKYFQASDYEKAAQSYTQAIKLSKDKALQAVLYRNRAACFLKKVRKAPPFHPRRAEHTSLAQRWSHLTISEWKLSAATLPHLTGAL